MAGAAGGIVVALRWMAPNSLYAGAMPPTVVPGAALLPSGGGETGHLLATTDWSGTALGPAEFWPASLKAIVRMMLATRQPTCLFWGPSLINLYNDGFITLLGEKHPRAMGQPARECWSDAWPVVGRLLTNVVERGDAVLFQEMNVPIVRQGRLEDAWWNYSYSPLFDDEGAIAGVLVVATETTTEVAGRKSLEAARLEDDLARQELQALFLQAPLPMALLKGPQHVFSLVNEPYRALVNRDVGGKPLREAFTEEEVAYYVPFIEGVYRTGESTTLQEALLRLSEDGGGMRDRFIDVGYHPYRNTDGAVTGVLAIIHDVTEQVQARRRESALREVAEAASGAKDEFLAMVSHELRNPLNAILGWSRILASGSREPSQLDKGLEIIERNAKAQSKLIDEILDVSRITSGKVVLDLRQVRLTAVIQGAVDSIRPAAETKAVGLVLSLDEGIELVADEDRLQQVVWNLLSNAVKFTGSGGTVRITTAREGSNVVILVADTGRGIPLTLLPFVFDRFRQGDASTTKHHAGLGLGLAIVRSLVELHGGSVLAHSEGEGRGAVFELVLPLRAVEPAFPSLPLAVADSGPAMASGAGWPSLKGTQVLVVDDENDARELVATVLQQAGAAVTAVASVAAAMAALASTPIAVVVSDIGMPSEDGYSLAQRMRTHASAAVRDIPALALTAYARAEERQRAMNAGFQEHLSKPFKPEVLIRSVAALAKRNRPL